MKEFYIRTWGCECGYRQDFEPTEELMGIHFPNNKGKTCPSCGTSKLKKETDNAKKCKMRYYDKDSKNALREKLLKKKNRDGETDDEKVARVDEELSEVIELTDEDVKNLKDKYEDR